MNPSEANTIKEKRPKPPTNPESEPRFQHRRINSNAVLSTLIGGALLGSLFSWTGAIIGGIIGGLLGAADKRN
jgi:predicted lipid-binding transport protein (Tim44 family)